MAVTPPSRETIERLQRLATEMSAGLADLSLGSAEGIAYRLRLARAYALALEEEISALVTVVQDEIESTGHRCPAVASY